LAHAILNGVIIDIVIIESAPTVRLRSIIPQFLCLDLIRSRRFYCERLGFEFLFQYEDFYAAVGRDGLTIHLKLSDEPDPSRTFKREHEHFDVYFEVQDIDAAYEEFSTAGVVFDHNLHRTPWGTREFTIADPDGYILYFGQRIEPGERGI